FDVGQPRIDIPLFRVRLRRGENTIEVGGISLVLRMVLERVYVDFRSLWGRRAWLEHSRHSSISPRQGGFAPAGQPSNAPRCPMTQNHQGDRMNGLPLLSAIAATSIAAALNAQVTTAKPDSTCTNYPDGRIECR